MKNESGLIPKGHAVLVEPYEPAKMSSIIQIPMTAQERSRMIENRATVVAVGSEAWVDEKEPRAAPGDKVLISQHAGALVQGTADGKWYRMVNDRDIYCQIEVEPS